ncbi:MAG TPA: hypothetical protein VF412_17055 [Bdellovibrio sp.]|uniref:hypothetical protein n=1 Tax=Bdellovibrio sp. TaxID=28201 RepID=UPI002EECB549
MGKLKSKAPNEEAASPATGEAIERVVLRPAEASKLDHWLSQLNERYDGLVKFTKSDLVNFLLRHQEAELTETQINLLGVEYYDELRWINRAIEKVRQAKRQGQTLSLEDLMLKRKPLEKIKMSLEKRERKASANEKQSIENQVEDNESKTLES